MSSTDSQTNLLQLIEKASEFAGSEYKVAKLLGIPQSHISEWKAGKRGCVPGDRARLAGIAQLDPVQELIRATIEQSEGTKRGDDLRHLLGKTLAASGAVIASAGAHAQTIFLTADDGPWAWARLLYTMYIIDKSRTKKCALSDSECGRNETRTQGGFFFAQKYFSALLFGDKAMPTARVLAYG